MLLGATGEKRTAAYMKYAKGASEPVAPSSAKSAGKLAGSAGQQGNAVRRSFAVFDIDGTLIRWQLYHAVVDRLAKKGLLGADAKERLHEARMHWKQREHPDAFHAYERALIAVYEAALPSLKASEFDKTVKEIVNEYKGQTYTYTRELVTRLKQNKYVLLAISGSHEELVKAIAKEYGFHDWIGSKYVRKDDAFTGESEIASFDKRSHLQKLIEKHSLTLEDSYAVGDSLSDAPMLAMVTHPIAFNPDQKLYAKARHHKWPVVVERKNVIYELEPHDGSYVLA